MTSTRLRLSTLLELLFGLTLLVALGVEKSARFFSDGGFDSVIDMGAHFSYQSATIAGLALLVSAFVSWRGHNSRFADAFRGAATLYMIVTGVVYTVLLNDADPQVAWVHPTIHYVAPVVMVVLWLMHPPAARIPNGYILRWLMYPWAYAAFVLCIYGPLRDDYVYGFLDPADGWFGVIKMIVILTVAAAAAAWVLIHLPLGKTPQKS